MIGGGVLKLERVTVICPACGQKVEAVARDGWVKGYCAVAKQYVDFQTMHSVLSSAAKKRWQDPDYRANRLTTQSADAKKRGQGTEYRANQSTAAFEQWQDPEYRARQKAAHTGRHLRVEARAKISAAHTGKHPTDETKAKISATLRGRRLQR